MQAKLLTKSLLNRFLRYVRIHTSSDPQSDTFPSTAGQMKFAVILAEELESLGLSEVEMDINGYVTATIPANIPGNLPVTGFVAHMDTSPDFSGERVNPQLVECYDGQPVVLNREKNILLDPAEFPELKSYTGQALVTTDGTTLLGADDKAGIAEIVTAAELMLNLPHLKHGKIRLAFTPDEEIGRGVNRFDVKKFGADFAFTVDGGESGELEYENFNAARAVISFTGKSVHPGAAKGKMVNALLVAQRFILMLPADQRPENTEAYEGFFHLVGVKGNVASAEIECLIRDHDGERFLQKKRLLVEITDRINSEYRYKLVNTVINDQYFNMRQIIEPVFEIVDLAKKAMASAGVDPKVIPIRGGTDGARLSYMGLPCPNLFTGGHNFHGPYEFIPVQSMEQAVHVILEICRFAPFMNKRI